jgi:hypothetical protein
MIDSMYSEAANFEASGGLIMSSELLFVQSRFQSRVVRIALSNWPDLPTPVAGGRTAPPVDATAHLPRQGHPFGFG